MQTFSFTLQRMPGGGYALWYAIDGQSQEPPQAYAARTTLHEVVQMTAIPMIEKHFAERAVIYQATVPHQVPLPPVDDGSLPLVATGPERRPQAENGLMDRLYNGADRLRNGSINILMAAWLGMLSLGARFAGLV